MPCIEQKQRESEEGKEIGKKNRNKQRLVTHPPVASATAPSSTSGPSGHLLAAARSTSSLSSASAGGPTWILRSSLPGRSRAGSTLSGLLVAATTTTGATPAAAALASAEAELPEPSDDEENALLSASAATASSSNSSCATTLALASFVDEAMLLPSGPPSSSRLGARPSISSKKTSEGEAALAALKREATARSESPT